jgi:DNA-binding response OmpR family regulator
MPTVLLIGEDELIQDTRAAVVRTTGAHTLCCNASSALATLAEWKCDLVILCHSVPTPRRTQLADDIRFRWPATPLLFVSSTRTLEQRGDLSGTEAVSSADPEHLVLRTVELLGRRAPRAETAPNCIPIRANALHL